MSEFGLHRADPINLQLDELHTKIEQLERELAEAAAFLDLMTDKLDGGGFAKDVADCRAMAKKLRGET